MYPVRATLFLILRLLIIMKHKLIMENWRNFQKINESMEKIQALGAEYSEIDDSRLDVLVSIARSVAMASFEPARHVSDEKEAYKALDGREREYVQAILAINREAFGDLMGAPASSLGDDKEINQKWYQSDYHPNDPRSSTS